MLESLKFGSIQETAGSLPRAASSRKLELASSISGSSFSSVCQDSFVLST